MVRAYASAGGVDPVRRDAGLATNKVAGWFGFHGGGELQLGETDDPKELIHGDAGKLHSAAVELGTAGRSFAAVGSGLRKLDSREVRGETAEAFRRQAIAESGRWCDVAHACQLASGALADISHMVQWAQTRAQEAIDQYTRGRNASDRARAAHNAKVAEYNTAVDAYDRTAHDRGESEVPPEAPGPFHDPGTADMEAAMEILANARRRRDAASESAERVISGTYAHGKKSGGSGRTRLDSLADLEKYKSVWEDISKPKKLTRVWKGFKASQALWGQFRHGLDAAEEFAKPGMMKRLISGVPMGTDALGAMDVMGKRLMPLNIAMGLKEVVSPDHKGAWGWADRGMGGAQALGGGAVLGGEEAGLLLGLEAGAACVPVVGEVVLGATAAYFVGSWVADKYGDDIEHGAKAAWHGTEHAYHTVEHKVGSVAHHGYSFVKKKVGLW